jgi:hypothetical protein
LGQLPFIAGIKEAATVVMPITRGQVFPCGRIIVKPLM